MGDTSHMAYEGHVIVARDTAAGSAGARAQRSSGLPTARVLIRRSLRSVLSIGVVASGLAVAAGLGPFAAADAGSTLPPSRLLYAGVLIVLGLMTSYGHDSRRVALVTAWTLLGMSVAAVAITAITAATHLITWPAALLALSGVLVVVERRHFWTTQPQRPTSD